MNWYKIFYLFSLADKIEYTFKVIAIICTVGFILSTVIHFFIAISKHEFSKTETWLNSRKHARKWQLFFGIFGIMSWSLWTFIPDRNDMLLIVAGGSVGQFVTTDENAKEIPADITRFLRKEILEATAVSSDEVKEALGIQNPVDTLKAKSKEELIKIIEGK